MMYLRNWLHIQSRDLIQLRDRLTRESSTKDLMDESKDRNDPVLPMVLQLFLPTKLEVVQSLHPNPKLSYSSIPNQSLQVEQGYASLQNHGHQLRSLQSESEHERVVASYLFQQSPHNAFALSHTWCARRCGSHLLPQVILN